MARDTPTGDAAAATATTPATSIVGAQSALDLVDELDNKVHGLRHELRSYGEPGMVGRDAQQLRQYFDELVGFTAQIAKSMDIGWKPTWSSSS